MVSKKFLAFSKGSRLFTDMSLNHASPWAPKSCIIIRFCFGTELHCMSSAFGIIPWFSVGRTNSTYTISPRVNNVVICGYMNEWCGFFIHTGQEELLHLSVHNQTWQESNMGWIMNHYIFIQSKIVKELFVEEYNWFVVWSEWLRIFPPAKPSSKGLSVHMEVGEPR